MRTRRALVAMAACAALAAMAVPASGGGAQLTKGQFYTFAAGPSLGYEVEGHATMVRTPEGTIVVVNANGLEPGSSYGSHVHNQACGDGDAGGHYSFGEPVPGGAAADGSEIWPGPFVANSGRHVVGQTTVGAVAGPEAVSIVIHAPSGAKIACADLS